MRNYTLDGYCDKLIGMMTTLSKMNFMLPDWIDDPSMAEPAAELKKRHKELIKTSRAFYKAVQSMKMFGEGFDRTAYFLNK